MIRANSVPLILSFLILWPLPTEAQVRPGLAHRLEVADRADTEAPASQAANHDPDRDGALIGAAVGAAGLSIIWYVRCDQGDLCRLAVIPGTIIGGLAGLVVGGLVDAADPLASRTDAPGAAPADTIAGPPAAPDSTVARAPATPDSTGHVRRRSPTSRRNDLIGAAIGAVAGDLLVYAACTGISESGSCPVFHWKYSPAIGIGALLGAGIGSAFGETEGPEEAEQPSP